MSKKLEELKVGDKFYYVNHGLGVCVLTATNILDCMSNEHIKVEVTCDNAPWPPIYCWKKKSNYDDENGTFYFDKEDVINLLRDTLEDLKTTLKNLQNEY